MPCFLSLESTDCDNLLAAQVLLLRDCLPLQVV